MFRNGAAWLRGALVVVAVAALLGVFGQSSLRRPVLGTLQIAGLAVMLLGLTAVVFAGRIAERFGRGREGFVTALKLCGLTVCAAGAIMVFIG